MPSRRTKARFLRHRKMLQHLNEPQHRFSNLANMRAAWLSPYLPSLSRACHQESFQSSKQACQWVNVALSMQVERLVRKMLLKLSSVAFPITLNPAYQLPGGTWETVEP